jgi:hypothetical protein
MQKIVCKALVLLCTLISLQCGSSAFNKLQGGQWVDRYSIEHKSVDGITDTETLDFMFLHKSGRYILFNDLGSMVPWLSIQEKGNWLVKDSHKLVLVADESDSVVMTDVKQFF